MIGEQNMAGGSRCVEGKMQAMLGQYFEADPPKRVAAFPDATIWLNTTLLNLLVPDSANTMSAS